MKADHGYQRARKKPNFGLVSILSLLSVTLTIPIWAQQGTPVTRGWQKLVPFDTSNDARVTSSGAPRVTAKLPFRLFKNRITTRDPFIAAGADAQWQLAETISPQESSTVQQAKTTQPYPWPQPVDSAIGFSPAVHADVATEDAESVKRPPTKLKLPSLGKSLRLLNSAARKESNDVVPRSTNGNTSGFPLPDGVQPRKLDSHLPDSYPIPPKPATEQLPLPQSQPNERPITNSQLPKAQIPNVATPALGIPNVATPQLVLPDLEPPQFPPAELPLTDSQDASPRSVTQVPKAPTAAEQERASVWGGGAGNVANSPSAAAPDNSLSHDPLSDPEPSAAEALNTILLPTSPQHAATPPLTDSSLAAPATAPTKASEKPSPLENKPTPPLSETEGHGNLVEATRVLALVGNHSILAGDVLGQVNELLKPYEGKAPQDELDRQRQLLVRQALPGLIDNKLVFLDFLRTIPDDKLPELESRVFKLFAETELPKLIEKANVKSSAELDAKLRELGSSLDKQRRLFMEKSIAGQQVRRGVNLDKEVTHDEMLEYYYEHSADYGVQARVRWEHLMTRFDRFEASRDEQTGNEITARQAAWKALAEMGNEVLRGAPSQAVARRSSQGPRAKDGGVHDWTTEGSLVSDELNKALFTLPTGRWSQIITDDDGFHIVRVIEREPAGIVPFSDVQDEIRESIQRKRFNEGVANYLAGLRESTYVWTAFDGELIGARAQIARPLTSPDSTLR